MKYQKADVPLVVLGGKEYGSGSSRDWAQGHAAARRARGDRGKLRTHPPQQSARHGRAALQYRAGETAQSLGLTGFRRVQNRRRRKTRSCAGD